MIVVRGGCERFAVCPGAPTTAVSFGLNGSWSQAVGVKDPWPSLVPLPWPTACSFVTAGPHEVGFVMKFLPLPLFALRVRLMLLIFSDRPLSWFGMLRIVDVRPESEGRTVTSDLRCCGGPIGASSRIPSCAGSGLSGTRLNTSPLASLVTAAGKTPTVTFTVWVPTLLA